MLDSLAAGADGIWCSMAEEGAALGHACSAGTLANLARLGNSDVLKRYNTRALAPAAREMTRIVTNKPVQDRQVVYGPRAVEAVFGFLGMGDGPAGNKDGDGDIDAVDDFSLADFLGVDEILVYVLTLFLAELKLLSDLSSALGRMTCLRQRWVIGFSSR